MSRPLRLEFAGALYHVTARGNAREDIFRDDGDRATFLDLLGREIGPFGGSGAAYRRFVTQGIGLPSVWEDLRGQMWLGDEPFRAKIPRAARARPPARTNCSQKLLGHLIFRAMRCSTAATRGRIAVRFICCGGW
jgi:hypothetical protein